jgi:hypothetical protein
MVRRVSYAGVIVCVENDGTKRAACELDDGHDFDPLRRKKALELFIKLLVLSPQGFYFYFYFSFR